MEATLGLIREPQRRRRLGAAARSLVGERFTIAHFIQAYIDLYESLAKKH